MSAARQLSLPLPGRRRGGQPPRLKRAHRDYTQAEFDRALSAANFRSVAGGTRFVDLTGASNCSIEGVFLTDPIRLARRATLAALMRARKATEGQL